MFGDLFICKNYTFGKVFGQNFDSNCLIRVHGKGVSNQLIKLIKC